MNKLNATRLARAGVIAALYAVTTIAFGFISYGPIQFRISEMLCVLPLFFPEAALWLTVGCLIANIFGNGLLDMLLGTLATLLGSIVTVLVAKFFKNKFLLLFLGGLGHVLFNAFLVPLTITTLAKTLSAYFLCAATVALGEAIVIYVGGTFVYLALYKSKQNHKISQ